MDQDTLQALFSAFIVVATMLLVGFPVHEALHAWTAMKTGGQHGPLDGRVYPRPARALRPDRWPHPRSSPRCQCFGVFGLLFGCAKPTPVNPSTCATGARATPWWPSPGPASNLVIAVIVALPMRLVVYEHRDRWVTSRQRRSADMLLEVGRDAADPQRPALHLQPRAHPAARWLERAQGHRAHQTSRASSTSWRSSTPTSSPCSSSASSSSSGRAGGRPGPAIYGIVATSCWASDVSWWATKVRQARPSRLRTGGRRRARRARRLADRAAAAPLRLDAPCRPASWARRGGRPARRRPRRPGAAGRGAAPRLLQGPAVRLPHRVAWSLGERYGDGVTRALARLPGFGIAFERLRHHARRFGPPRARGRLQRAHGRAHPPPGRSRRSRPREWRCSWPMRHPEGHRGERRR